MVQSQFQTNFNRLKSAYGDKIFPAEREELFWRRFRQVAEAEFRLAIDAILLKMPAAHTILEILDDRLDLRQKTPSVYKSQFNCDPCRDFGYGFVNDLLVRCYCPLGKNIDDWELAKHQANYEKGKAFFMKTKNMPTMFTDLPYNPTIRGQ